MVIWRKDRCVAMRMFLSCFMTRKNMNSIRNVQRAIDHEVERQIAMLEKGEEVISETRTFDAATGKTHSMRTKEELNDYRYFPDPDLSPVIVSEEWLSTIKASMPA